MCGRLVRITPASEIAEFFEAEPPVVELGRNFNVAPTSEILTVGEGSRGRSIRVMHWGLVPPWATDTSGASRLINARAETVAEKPSFRSAFRRRRCLIPVDGFYEWTTVPGALRKQPMFIRSATGEPLAFAGLHEFWVPPDSPDGAGLFSCCIITCAANALVGRIHDRMPAILARRDWPKWLDSESTPEDLLPLLVPAPEDLLVMHPVSPEVNSVRNNGPHLLEAIEPTPVGEIPGQGTLL